MKVIDCGLMKRRGILATCILKPISLAYGAGVTVRNKMFDYGILRQHEFDIPVVVIGNIAIGGTGKTPHTEYLINLLRYKYNIGVLSRGYKRKSKGFILATAQSSAAEIGDEAYQIYRKYNRNITVAVCEDRVRGIEEMRRANPAINLILLDDAFQHRYVKPTVSIVLTEFGRPAFQDHILPMGRLRESTFAFNRADMVIVTKCPENIKPMEYRIFKKQLNLYPYQKLFFSKFEYGNLTPVFPSDVSSSPFLDWLTDKDAVLAIAGIANPVPFVKYLRRYKPKVKHLLFSDHHDFTKSDISLICDRFKNMKGERKYVITTEKDAVRLMIVKDLPQWMKASIFYIPVKVDFMPYSVQTSFDDTLLRMISENMEQLHK